MEQELIKPFHFFCHHCKYKKRITQIVQCKCGNKFCFSCKYPEKHNCLFDYQKENRNDLNAKLVKQVAKKINKII